MTPEPATFNVMHLLATYEVGGAEAVALELARAMNGEDLRVGVAALFGTGAMRRRFEQSGVRTLAVREGPQRDGFELGLTWRLARILQRERVDVLHCHNRRAHVYGVMAARVARRPAVVCTLHGFVFREPNAAERLAGRFASHTVGVCRAVLDQAVRVGRVSRRRSSVIYNGVEPERFAPERGAGRRGRELALVCVARLAPEKGHDVLLRALAALAGEGRQVRLDIIGDGPERAALEALARQLGVASRVRFLGRRDDVPKLLGEADAFVLPSLSEAFPLTVLEAMASGLPVVATAVGGVPEAVRDGETGLMVAPGEPGELAGALARVLDDGELARSMGRAGRRRVEELFSLEATARRHARLYRRLAGYSQPVDSSGAAVP